MQNSLRIDQITGHTLFSLQWHKHAGFIKELIYTQFANQKQNIFLWIPVIFACGIGCYFYLPFEPPLTLAIFLVILTIALYSFVHSKQNLYSQIIFLLLIFISGFSAATYRTHSISTPIITKKISFTSITGRISQIEKLDEGQGSRIILDQLTIEDLTIDETPKKLRLTVRKDNNLRAGERVNLLAGLNPPSGPLIPGGFDFRRYLYFQEIGAVGFVYNAPVILPNDSQSLSIIHGWNNFIEDLRQRIELRVYDVLPPRQATIAAALLVGKKNAISDEDQQAVRDAGLAHMLAISGLHVGIFSGTLFFIFRFLMACIPALALHYPIKKIAAVFAFASAVFYMFLAGSTVPTQRSVLMGGIVFLAIILDRSPISLRLVAASALIVLLFKPESLLSVSFQMSFAAVASLVYFYDVTRQLWIRLYTQAFFLKKLALYFLGICLTTIIASIATAPFSLYHFGQVSFIGSASNLIAGPLLGFIIMPFALLSLVLMPFGIDEPSLTLMGYGIEGMLDISYWAASLPYAIVRNSMWPFSAFLLINVACLFMMLWKGIGKLIVLPFLIIGMIATQKYIMPDILISGSHKLFVFRERITNQENKEGDKLYTSTRRSDRFVLRNWENIYGLPEKSAQLLDYKGNHTKEKNRQSPFHQCGEQGCRFTIKNTNISFVRSAYILKEECNWADIVISVEPLPRNLQCRTYYVIDKFDTWEKETHAVWIRKEDTSMAGIAGHLPDITIKTVIESQKDRPWTRFSKKTRKKNQPT